MTNLKEVDLNLLIALDALLDEGSVTRAARRVGLSQPAMSNALARLRRTLGDEVLVRSAGGMVPTPRALELAGPVRDALDTISRALSQSGSFDPATAENIFKIATTDYTELVLLPRLAALLKDRAPKVRLQVQLLDENFPREDLESGRLDLAVGIFRNVPTSLYKQALFQDKFICVVRRDHPTVQGDLTLQQYTELDHVLISVRGDARGVVDHVLAQQNLERRVALTVPHFLVAPLVVTQTDLVLTLASQVGCYLAEALDLQVFQPPLELPIFTVNQIWHGRFHHDPAHRFLRGLLAEIAHEVNLPGCDTCPEPDP